MYMDAMAEIIVIPGTGLVIAHGPAFVACWDISTELCVGRLALDRDLVVESASFEQYGTVMLGLFSPNATIFQVAGVCVDYHDRAAVTISLALAHTFAFPRLHFHKASQVSVDNGNVRVIATTSEPLQYHLFSVSFSGEERVVQKILPEKTRASSPWGAPAVSIIPSPNGPYFMRHMQNYADIAHLPARISQTKPSIIQVPLEYHNKSLQLKKYTPSAPTADVVNIAVGDSRVEFWHASLTAEGQLVFGNAASYTFGWPSALGWPSNNVIGGASGIYTLLGVSGHPESPLRLLRYVPGGPPVLRELRIPVKTLYINEGRLALDDHFGLILSLRGDGKLCIVSYA
ncbi:hypothetical protein MVEN_00689800 [Mycena venus]|uniref:Uncharacterized protein n=1 Tax=Mycena venus TaxID=2733690 RepID=A0A8H6YID1_9AGAR|nr:hypothetical protein MVEN_00689800 [Mycena venus]